MAEETSVHLVQPAAGESSAMSLATLLLFPLMMMLILLPLRYFFSTRSAKSNSSKLPPSPPALLLIGHGHLIGSLPHVSLRDLARWHGGEDGLMLGLSHK
uniref:Uncharacterized protein n=1 Tax=Leersia perrieri TaxID=77586 RepID=A0A0D9XIZ3_9ORYZ